MSQYRVVLTSHLYERIEKTITCETSCDAVVLALNELPIDWELSGVTVRVEALDERPERGGDDEKEQIKAEQHQRDTELNDLIRSITRPL